MEPADTPLSARRYARLCGCVYTVTPSEDPEQGVKDLLVLDAVCPEHEDNYAAAANEVKHDLDYWHRAPAVTVGESPTPLSTIEGV